MTRIHALDAHVGECVSSQYRLMTVAHRMTRAQVPCQIRHTCATLWLGAGENPEWIARQLGHTTTEMLFRVYSRYVPNLTRRDGSAFDRMVSAALNGGITGDKENVHA